MAERAAQLLGRIAEARGLVSAEQAAVARDPTNVSAWTSLGLTRSNVARAASGAAATDAFRSAIEAFDRALALHPRSAQGLWFRGSLRSEWSMKERAAGRDPMPLLAQAEADLDAALEINRSWAWLWEARGAVRMRRSQVRIDAGQDSRADCAAAAADLDEAVKRNPGDRSIRFNRCEALRILGEQRSIRGQDARELFDRALTDADALIALDPENHTLRAVRGILLPRQGRLEEAQAELERAFAHQPALETVYGPTLAFIRMERACALATRPVPGGGGPDPREEAFRLLAALLDSGHATRGGLEREPRLASLRADPRWKERVGRGR